MFQVLSVEKVSGDASEDRDSATADASNRTCLSDDFSALAINEVTWTVQDTAPVATATQEGGNLVLTLGQAAGNNYALIASPLLDLTHDAVSVEVVERPNAATVAEAGLSLQLDYGHRYQLFVTGAYLLMRVSTPATGNDNTSLPYSAENHHFLRLRHVGDNMLWETSADRMSWTVRRASPAAVDVASLFVQVFAGTYQADAELPGRARFDNVLVECLP